MGSRLAPTVRSEVCISPARSLGVSSSSSLETEKLGKLPCGSGIGGAIDKSRPATSGSGTNLVSRETRRGITRFLARLPTRALVSASRASTSGVRSGRGPHSSDVATRSCRP